MIKKRIRDIVLLDVQYFGPISFLYNIVHNGNINQ